MIQLLALCVHSSHTFSIFLPCRDLVHRQTACWAVKHMALGVHGFGCDDGLVHLMNYVWPNIFETAPHMMQSFHDAVDGFRVSIGPTRVLLYTLQVCRHATSYVVVIYNISLCVKVNHIMTSSCRSTQLQLEGLLSYYYYSCSCQGQRICMGFESFEQFSLELFNLACSYHYLTHFSSLGQQCWIIGDN